MAITATMKGPLMGFILLLTYANMVLDIIQITKASNGYAPAAVAMLVCAILQMLYTLYYFVRSGKGVVFRATNVLYATVFFFLFNLGAIIAFAVLRHHAAYCPPGALNYGDCNGVTRGTMGLGFALVGTDLIVFGWLAAFVRQFGTWNDDLYNLPPRAIPNADLEKAPAH